MREIQRRCTAVSVDPTGSVRTIPGRSSARLENTSAAHWRPRQALRIYQKTALCIMDIIRIGMFSGFISNGDQ